MKERPIIFSTNMVQAILDERKTQTRRVIKKQPHGAGAWVVRGGVWVFPNVNPYVIIKCPYGEPGDLLYVRESFGFEFEGEPVNGKRSTKTVFKTDEDANPIQWKPSIHMPKKAARIWLKVKDIWVERVQDISDEDALLEGCLPDQDIFEEGELISAFAALWDSINKKRGYGWEKNPWVWAVDFEVISTNGKP